MKNNEHGFALITLIAMLPFLLAIIAVLFATVAIVKQDGATRHTCRVDLLNAQAQVAEDLATLLEMNTAATELRLAREEADAEVEATIETPFVAVALLHQEAVIAEQVAFHAEQLALITKARTVSQLAPRTSIAHVRTLLETEHRVQEAKMNIGSSFISQTSAGHFDVIAEQEDSITPNYRTAEDFSRTQEMRAEWSVDVGALLPKWITHWIPASGFNMKADCSTTLTKDKSLWRPQITMGKRSLNLSSALRSL